MKTNPIWDNLTHIREDFIEEASPDRMKLAKLDRKKRIRNRFIRWGSLAACLLILIGATSPLWNPQDAYAQYPTRNEHDFMEQYPCIAIIPTFPYEIDGELCPIQYPSLIWQEQEYYVATAMSVDSYYVSADLIEDEIGQVTADAQNMRTDTYHPVNFTLYRIEGIDETIAFAVSYEGGENYAVYRSANVIEADSWSELVERIDLQTHLTASKNIFFTPKNKRGEEVRLVFEGMTSEILWDQLLSHGEITEFDGLDGNYLRISIDHSILSTPSTLCVTADGYITFGMIKSGKALYVGKERVSAFVEYLESNLTGYRLVSPEEAPAPADTGNPQTVTVTSAAPSFNPKPQ